ncbi:hypothetical protein SUNI508_09941 [Seiridium unicorne]|uniref:Uncharacterized protein n=1 Tax=Seiridium unicorne TaxID=138068 RepID=A0ABR2UN41_9PEZI
MEDVKRKTTKVENTSGFIPPWQAFKQSSIDRVTSNESNSDDQVTERGIIADKGLRGKALMVIFSLLLFIGLVVLQIIGLASAVQGLPIKDSLQSTWCSPMLESFALVIVDGNCHMHDVSSSASKGIGCTMLSGEKQSGWLTGTVAFLTVSLILELVDMLVLILVDSHAKWRQVKMRRPWCTMFCGISILILYVIYGLLEASRLPSGMPEVVWVFRREPSLQITTVCQGAVTPAGARGSIMGWTDGFLSNWGRAYFG